MIVGSFSFVCRNIALSGVRLNLVGDTGVGPQQALSKSSASPQQSNCLVAGLDCGRVVVLRLLEGVGILRTARVVLLELLCEIRYARFQLGDQFRGLALRLL